MMMDAVIMIGKRAFAAAAAVLLFGAAVLPAAAAEAASDKIGFIDTQKVLVAHPKYAESQKHVDEFISKKAEDAKAAAEKEKDVDKRVQIIEAARKESGNEEMRVMNPITADINKVIEKVAKSKGVTVVLEKVYIFFGGVDITDDVVKGVQALK